MNFKIESGIENELTIDDLVELQEGKAKAVRDILSKFAVDDAGNKIEVSEARKQIGKMKLSELEAISKKFGDALAFATANPTTASS